MKHPGARRPVVPLLVLGLVAAGVAFLISVVAAGLVFPLFDLTPSVVLCVALAARRWGARPSRLFDAVLALSAVLIVQWIAWDLWFVRTALVATPYALDQMIGPIVDSASRVYLSELAALLALYVVAAVLAALAVRRQRMAASQAPVSPDDAGAGEYDRSV